jgi:predicted nucleic acid-binding protein
MGEVRIYIPAMAVAEIGYLSNKGKIELSVEKLENYIRDKNSYTIYPQDLAVIKAAFDIDDIPELHDKLIAGTAKVLSAKLITNDPKTEASSFIQTVWK